MKKILLIEQAGAGTNTRDILILSKFTVFSVRTITKGITVGKAERPDLIICDSSVSGGDIPALIHPFHEEPALRFVPIIVLTTEAERSRLRRIMASGADDYLLKPFEGVELLRAVDACFEKQARRHSHACSPHPVAGSMDPPWRPEDRDTCHYNRKTQLYSEGQRASQIWYIVNGRIKTYRLHPDGKELITGIYGAGDCVGYMAAIGGGPFTDNATILEDADLVAIPRHEFLQLLGSDSALARQLIHWLARNAEDIDAGLLNLAYSSLRKKVANGILSLATTLRQQEKGKRFIQLSRENLAAFVGAAPESLTRTLGDFRKEGLIDLADGRIWLLNEEKLRKLFN